MASPAHSSVSHCGEEVQGTQDAINQLMTIFQSLELYQYWSLRISVTLGQKSDKVSLFLPQKAYAY